MHFVFIATFLCNLALSFVIETAWKVLVVAS